MNGAAPARVVLVDQNLDQLGGHWSEYVPILAEAAVGEGAKVTVVAVDGIAPPTRQRLTDGGAEVVTVGQPALRVAARLLREVYERTHARWPRSKYPYQFLLFHRCLAEAAALRAVPGDVVVVLSASECLAATAARLSGRPHVRIVHDVYSWEGPFVRLAEALSRTARRHVTVVCPTTFVQGLLRERQPNLATVVRPFALRDPVAPIGEQERRRARRQLGVHGDGLVGCFVGGWWRSKDYQTVASGFCAVSRDVALIVAGYPVDARVVDRLRGHASGRVIVRARQLTSDEVREVYAASDFTVVSRLPGDGKESGLVMDAARFGIPLVISDHDATLNRSLAAVSWVRFFRAGDPRSLAATLDALPERPLRRPDATATHVLGMQTGKEALALFRALTADGSVAARPESTV